MARRGDRREPEDINAVFHGRSISMVLKQEGSIHLFGVGALLGLEHIASSLLSRYSTT
jgi:hypothetical protein